MRCMHCGHELFWSLGMYCCTHCKSKNDTGRDPHAPAKKNPKESGTVANGVVNCKGKEGRL